MMLLLINIDEESFAIRTSEIHEILPMVEINKLHGNDRQAGIINYRGEIVNVIDLAEIISHRPSRNFLSTRIIIIKQNGNSKFIAIVAEKSTETRYYDENSINITSEDDNENNLISGIIIDGEELINIINIKALSENLVKQS